MVRAALATSRSFNVPTFQQGVATPHRGMSLRCAAACTTHVSIDIGPSLPECGLPFRSRFHSFRVRDQRRRRIKKHGTDGRPRRPRRRPKQRADAWEADGDFHKQHPHDVRRDAEREGGREGGRYDLRVGRQSLRAGTRAGPRRDVLSSPYPSEKGQGDARSFGGHRAPWAHPDMPRRRDQSRHTSRTSPIGEIRTSTTEPRPSWKTGHRPAVFYLAAKP